MNILDDLDSINKIDSGKTLLSISFFPNQCEEAWRDISKLSFPDGYKEITRLLFCGMGGSAYGAHIIRSLYRNVLGVSCDLDSDYHLPSYVDDQTLIIAASYSGNTEETISCVTEAIESDRKIIGITSGGKLAEILSEAGKPVYKFIPSYNPSGQPRIGQGYMQLGQIAILKSLGLIQLEDLEINSLIKKLFMLQKHLIADVQVSHNQAKEYAMNMKNKIIHMIGAEFLEGAVHAIRNPFHETAKHFANYSFIPEANHHLMEGLKFPVKNSQNLLFVMINSSLYSDSIKRRMKLTKDVIEKNDIPILDIHLISDTKLSQVFELIQFGSFLSFYLAILHGVDPAKIPWVDYFKKKLENNTV